MSAQRITWKDAGYSSYSGSVGGIALFTIYWRSSRSGKDWILECNLPGQDRDLGDFDSTDEAKDQAEQVLVQFVEQLGAKF